MDSYTEIAWARLRSLLDRELRQMELDTDIDVKRIKAAAEILRLFPADPGGISIPQASYTDEDLHSLAGKDET